jgi:uncharacterized integral membrane protein
LNLVIALLCILFFGAVLLLVVLNPGAVDVNLFFRAYPRVPVAVVIVFSLLTGILFTSLISIMDGVRIRIQNRQLRKRLARIEDEMEALRHAPEPPNAGTEAPPPFDSSFS